MRISASLVLSLCSLIFAAQAALLGIDFGTEYTKAILVAPNVPFDILLTSESKRKNIAGLAVTFDNTNKDDIQVQRMFGTHALSTCIKIPQSCLLFPKPLLGLGYKSEQIDDYISKLPGTTLGIQNGRDAVTVVASNKDETYSDTFLIEEVAAMIFIEIKSRAVEYWKERSPETVGTIDEVAISIPRYFNDAARTAITDAAELAGLKVVALVDDGLAIALDYAQKKTDFKINEKEYHLIFDCGAGSTKLSLVSFANINDTNVNIELESYAFSDQFNGQLFTKAVRNLILNQLVTQNNISTEAVINDFKAMQKLWQAAEKAKLILSANSDTKVNIESVYENIDFKGIITREELEKTLESHILSIPYVLDSVFVGYEDIKANLKSVILAGGSSRVPAVQAALTDYFGSEEISKNVNADESVVFGTTLRGAQILKLTRKSQFNVIDRSPYSHDIYYKSSDGTKGGKIEVPTGLMPSEKRFANLTEFDGSFIPQFSIDVFQNDKTLSHSYNMSIPHRVNKTICDSPRYEISYGLTRHNAFIVNNVKVHCTFNDTTKVTPMISYSKLHGFDPMPSMMKKTSIKRLTAMEMQEEQRHRLADLKNSIEAKLYELRYILEEYEEVFISDLTEELNGVISEHLEWLDYDSDNAKFVDVAARLDNVNALVQDVHKYTLVATPQFAKVNVIDVYNELKQKKDEIVKKIEMETAEKDMIMEAQCNAFGVDFSKIGSKHIWPTLEVDSQFSQLKELCDLAATPGDVEEYKAHVREIATAVDAIEDVNNALDAFVKEVDNVYELKSAFVRQKVLAAERASKKAAAAAATAASPTATVESTTTTDIISEDTPQHDEL